MIAEVIVRSGQPWQGNDMNTYADDLAKLMESLDLKDVNRRGVPTPIGELSY
jgi:non-heme chloroperoxidase